MEHLTTPAGPVRLRAELVEPAYTDCHTVQWSGSGVSIYFWQNSISSPTGHDPDGTIGDVVAHVFMTREHFENLGPGLQAIVEMRAEAKRSPETDFPV